MEVSRVMGGHLCGRVQNYAERPEGWRPEVPLTEGPWTAPFGAGRPDRIENDVAAKKAARAARKRARKDAVLEKSADAVAEFGVDVTLMHMSRKEERVAKRRGRKIAMPAWGEEPGLEGPREAPDVDWAEMLGKDHRAEALEAQDLERLVQLGALTSDDMSALA